MTDTDEAGKIADERYRLAEERYADFKSGFLHGVRGPVFEAVYDPPPEPKHLDWYKRGMMAGRAAFHGAIKGIGNDLGLVPTRAEAPPDERYMEVFDAAETALEHPSARGKRLAVERVRGALEHLRETAARVAREREGEPVAEISPSPRMKVDFTYTAEFEDGTKHVLNPNYIRNNRQALLAELEKGLDECAATLDEEIRARRIATAERPRHGSIVSFVFERSGIEINYGAADEVRLIR